MEGYTVASNKWKNDQLSAMWFGYLLTLAYTALCVRGNCTEHNWACDK